MKQNTKLNKLSYGWIAALTVTIASGTLVPAALANVSVRNGDFFVGYTDISYPGGFEPKIERVYNSKTPFKGMFGWGWGNEYEVFLNVSADGSVVVHEYGGGAENRFEPIGFTAKELEAAVTMIAGAAKTAGMLATPSEINSYKAKLRGDADFRNDEWENFRKSGRLKERQLPVNTQLKSNRFSYQYITKVKDGYVRSFDTGRTEKFDLQGRLLLVTDKNRNFLQLSYGVDGHLNKIVDNFNRKIFLTFNDHGLVERIQGENGKEASFKYDSLDELVYSKDVDGVANTYKYDSAKRHNLLEIGYSDNTTQKISYYPKEERENVKSVKDRDGTLTEYSYEDSKDKDHIVVSVSVKDNENKSISNKKYEYFLKHKTDGEEWTERLVTTIDGHVTDTTYNEAFGLPTSIKHDGAETKFGYDVRGHVTLKNTPEDVTEITYDPKVSKISSVVQYPHSNPKDRTWSKFKYDAKGNLIYAENSDKKKVKLVYDNNGRIATMVDQDRRRVDFKYNENSKPVQITDPAVGSINVTYTNSGEIKKVDSAAGRRVAVQVTSAIQNLVDIIKPAGVNLSF